MFSRSLVASAASVEETRHGLDDDLVVEGLGAARRQSGVRPADDLGGRGRGEVLVARVLALGREGQEEVPAALEPAGLEDRQHHLVGRAGVGGALEDDELALAEVLGDGDRSN